MAKRVEWLRAALGLAILAALAAGQEHAVVIGAVVVVAVTVLIERQAERGAVNLVIWGVTDEAGEFEFRVNYPPGDWVVNDHMDIEAQGGDDD